LKAAALRSWIIGLGIKARSIRQILIPLRGAIELAIIDEIIENNPLDRMMMKKILNPDAFEVEFETAPFSAEEISAMLAGGVKGQVLNVFQFALCTGMRPSEYITLRWPSISMAEFKIAVERSRSMGVSREKLKTQAARRLIDMHKGAHDALLAQMEHTYLAGGLVFQDPSRSKAATPAAAGPRKGPLP
jgi:integrase